MTGVTADKGQLRNCSVILPSHNGADTLSMTLAALEVVEGLPANAEIILIDNASTDETSELMHQFAKRTPALILTEPRRGKSYALNRAIEAASGELLIFMDDDVIVSPEWLLAFKDAADANPEIGAFAGQVRPYWASDPPDWLKSLSDLGRACGCTAVNAPAGPFRATDIKGANIAVRKRTLGKLRFDVESVNFGASATPIGGEDTRLLRILEEHGNEIFYVPDALCRHHVSAAEMSVQSVFHRYVRIGRSSAANAPYRTNAILHESARVASAALWAIWQLIFFNRMEAANLMIRAAMGLGALDYAMNRRKFNPSSNG